ncbi:MAG: flavodoxin family protein [Desulfovibrionaceae bacterium]|nr:flavodoxin family protein [Desulfovibrionaceae bacterium]
MKVCALFGGPHKKGNTAKLLEAFLDGLRGNGHLVQRIDLVELTIQPCKGCMACKKPTADGCIQKDDMHGVLDSVQEADLLIFASPMYWWNLAGPLKNAIDRFFSLPFNATAEKSVFSGKKLLLVMTSGQPSERDGREGLELIMQRMCSFTGMEWLGTITAGTNNKPISEQSDVLKAARLRGSSLA